MKEAEESLKHLDQALRKSGVKVDIDVTADVKNSTSFFEETVGNMKKEKEEFELKVKLKSGKKEHIEAVTPKNVGITMVEDTYVDDDDKASSSDEEDDEEISEEIIAKGALLFVAIVDNKEDCTEISMEQFTKALATPKSIELSEEEKKQLFAAIDQDSDGKISMDEFVAYFASYSEYLYDVLDAVVPNSVNETEWYYLNTNGETVGPYSLMQFIQLYQQKVITDNTNVWNADIETWHVLETVNSLVSHIEKS